MIITNLSDDNNKSIRTAGEASECQTDWPAVPEAPLASTRHSTPDTV